MGHCKDRVHWYKNIDDDDVYCVMICAGSDASYGDDYMDGDIVAPDYGCDLFEAMEENQ